MDITKTGEFFTGLQNIEREIIAKLRDRGIHITTHDFVWNDGKAIVSAEAVTLEIRVQGRSDNAIVSREQAEGSCDRIENMDVVAMIDSMVERLSH